MKFGKEKIVLCHLQSAILSDNKIAAIALGNGVASQPRLVFVFVEGRFLQVRVDATSLGVGAESPFEQKNVIFGTDAMKVRNASKCYTPQH